MCAESRSVLRRLPEPQDSRRAVVCVSPPQPSQKKPRSVPTLRRTADVRGGPRVDGALGVLGQGILPRPVEVVHLVLHEATDLLVLEAAGVICREGQGMVSCSFSNLLLRLPGCLRKAHAAAVAALRLCVEPRTDGQPPAPGGGWKGKFL